MNSSIAMDMTDFEHEFNRTGEYHSVLAMEAARKMRRTRQKKRTGQKICHHLKMMLESEPATVSSITRVLIVDNRTVGKVNPNGLTPGPKHSEPQYQLGF